MASIGGLSITEIVALIGVALTAVTTFAATKKSRTDALSSIGQAEERLRKALTEEIDRLEEKIEALGKENAELKLRIEQCPHVGCPLRQMAH